MTQGKEAMTVGNLQAKVGDVWVTPCGNKVEWMRTLDIGVQVRANDVKINGEYPAVGDNLPRWWPRNTKGRPMLAPRHDFTVYRNGNIIQVGNANSAVNEFAERLKDMRVNGVSGPVLSAMLCSAYAKLDAALRCAHVPDDLVSKSSHTTVSQVGADGQFDGFSGLIKSIEDAGYECDTHARAYAAVMGVDWSKVKSWREVDGAIEFEME